MRKIFQIFFFCISLWLCVFVSANAGSPAHNFNASHVLLFIDSLKIDTAKSTKSEIKPFRMRKSPWLAVLQSAVLPGLGQFYNESYWKIPIFLGLSAYLGYEIYNNTKTYHDYRDRYANSQLLYPPDGDLSLKTLRNFYHDQRDEFIWYFAIVYVVNLVDAYVDAHLFDFDVRESRALGIKVGVNPANHNLNLSIHF